MDLAKIRKKAKSSAGEDPAPAAPASQPPETDRPQLPQVAAVEKPLAPARKKEVPVRATVIEAEGAPPPLEAPARRAGSCDQIKVAAPPPPPPPRAAQPGPDEPAAPERAVRLEKLLVFAVGSRRYAIPIHDISQIIEDQGVTPVPHAPDFLLGIFSLRGRIVSVLDSARRLGVEAYGAPEAPKIVVLDAGEELVGIRVHAIDQVVEVDTGSLEPPPESFQRQQLEFVEGVFHHRERIVSFLNLPLFLAFESGGTSS